MMRGLGHPRAPAVLVVFATLLVLPSLTVGRVADDWLMELFLADAVHLPGVEPQPFRLFTFATGEPVRTEAMMNTGVFPWWTDPAAKLAFMRPLAALSHQIDHWLWPNHPVLMHVHSIAWFVLVLCAVLALYRRFLGHAGAPHVAAFALLLYGLDDAHGPAVGWISNRNAMMTAALGLPVVLVHDRWRRDGWRTGAWLGPALLAVALAAGEGAFGALAYLLAHAIHLERGPLASRLRALTGPGVVLAGYAALYWWFGYGVGGSDLYLDPLRQPGRFAVAVLERVPMLLLGQLALPWSDVSGAVDVLWPGSSVWVALTSAALVGAILWVMRPALRLATVRFFATGMALSCIPIAGAFPADRLLWFVGVGGMAWVAIFVLDVVQRIDTRRSARALAVLLIVIHGVLSPPLLASRSRSMEFTGHPLRVASNTLPAGPEIEGKTLILVNPPADPIAGYLLMQRAANGVPRPERLRWLAVGSTAVDLHRVDERTLIVRQHGGFYPRPTERMLRSRSHPFRPGELVELEEVVLSIDAVTSDGRPSVVSAHFDRPLDDPHYVWAYWKNGGFRPYAPPTIGESEHFPAVDLLEVAGFRSSDQDAPVSYKASK